MSTFTIREKKKLKQDLFKTLFKNKNVISITLVGSFWESKKSNDFSDIDIVIILKKFNKKTYLDCLKKIRDINLRKYNLGHLETLINSTFGPLKFYKKNNIVFHTMIYDIKSHIEHVIKSPFTCYDWERSSNYKGISLKDIFPVGRIQLIDFFNSRRGINSYLNNLNKNFISYQEYDFAKNFFKLKDKKHKINDRHKLEFSYHLCNFLIINFYKFQNQKNKVPSDNEIKSVFKLIFGKQHIFYLNNFYLFQKLKKKRISKIKFNTIPFLKKFITKFQSYLIKNNKQNLILIRHGKTKYNDGSFLGVGRDPGIINKKNVSRKLNYLKKIKSKIVYSSTLKRSLETAKTFENINKIIHSNHLIEKNYGLAEGLTFKKLKKEYPLLVDAWNKKRDKKFPKGESDADVLKRVSLFHNKLKKDLRNNSNYNLIIVVTHNALLRCYLGKIFEIPKYLWVKIAIDHIQPIHFIIKNNQIIPNVDRVNLFKKIHI